MASVLTAFRRIAHVGLRDYARRMVVHRGAPRARATGHRSFVTGTQPLRSDNKVTIHFVNRDGEKITVGASPGDSLLDIVINEDLDFDGFGACEGTLACSTCHLIFDEDVYKKLGPVTDEEMDMLDLAYGLTDTSRLGCQVCVSRSLEGMVARVPESVADIRQSKDGSS
ncbi:adrenodoxin [Nerophis lumbriciformis]|uniref:adrenodoxin n=1 Tax=Nerophis lumbriciformis TaxID=546530 RepID=UPI002ADFCD49|nr:adrenodoxin-like [Nerophis lumbriciformis]